MSMMISAPVKSAILDTPKAIVNASSTNGAAAISVPSGGRNATLSGAVTANTLKTIINITGAGVIDHLTVASNNTTNKTMRAVLTLDGVVVFDSTCAATASSGFGLIVVGILANIGSYVMVGQAVPFKTSAVLQITSSVTETNGIEVDTVYTTN